MVYQLLKNTNTELRVVHKVAETAITSSLQIVFRRNNNNNVFKLN